MSDLFDTLTVAQVQAVVGARRSLPIGGMSAAAAKARGLLTVSDASFRAVNEAHNRATRAYRDLGMTDALTLVTFQVACEEHAIAEAVKAELSSAEYDLLTFPVRSVVDPENTPALATVQRRSDTVPPATDQEEQEPMATKKQKPSRGAFGNRPSSAAGRKRAQEAAQPRRKPAAPAAKQPTKKAHKVSQKTLDELKDFLA